MACPYCGGRYSLGPNVGDLMANYPKAEYRYWHHCLTERHQAAIQHRWAITQDHLRKLEGAMARGKTYQKELRDPQRLALLTLFQ